MSLLKAELKEILKNRKLLIPIIAVLFVPILYAGMFLWAFWDPYERLDDLPVAIVNEDRGADFEGTNLELGKELVTKLKDSKDFNFQFVSKKEAYKGLKQQKYYMLVEIPENFSENATTLMDDHPKKLDLTYVPNESFNFLSSQIGETAVLKIQTSLQEKITETYAETMFDKIGELADGMGQASDGAGKLSDGVSSLNEGSEKLHEHLTVLAEKSVEFNAGVNAVNSGSNELASGTKALSDGLGQLKEGHGQLQTAADKLADGNGKLATGISQTKDGLKKAQTSIPDLISGTEQLQTGAETLASGLSQWQQGANQAANGAGQLNNGIAALEQQLEQVMPALPPEKQAALKGALQQLSAGSQEVKDGTAKLSGVAGQLSSGAKELSNNLVRVNEGQKALQAGINQLATGSEQLDKGSQELIAGQQQFRAGMETFGAKLGEAHQGSSELAAGSTKLSTGLNQLKDGSHAFTDGAGQLADGSEKLKSGTSELLEGSQELAGKLADGADEVSGVKGKKETYNMMAKPIEVKQNKLNEVPNYGTGFAPYFVSLGLFVGALLLSIVFPLTEPMTVPRNGFSWFASKFIILVTIGVIQALLAVFVLLVGLDLQVQSVPMFIFFTIITSITFVALIQFFVSLFGDPGRFMAIIILIMQLTTSAGTFPLELIPNILQPFNSFLPMTYTVHGFKAVISSGDFGFMWQNVGILSIFILIFMVGTLGYFNFKHKRQFASTVEQS
ncbi:YhgE/Pip domain-containing protein [Bacillus aquiflavi]|uniref:YhgE/Pip domain-containing protein n=1 Tax=Bacillus aquiflavi TaxID=2672567 RepID=A0A6B3VUX2_9BACI|nr:YhgE/Pip domain-containing protein [Bacillus aquiflavi]MBA4535689.1 YhgE/Pip domain-containing protein [Bacillus aquiflavi]NEY80065.1 YhgE/Pip domain-containing protein [Bacillus aquiflavi]